MIIESLISVMCINTSLQVDACKHALEAGTKQGELWTMSTQFEHDTLDYAKDTSGPVLTNLATIGIMGYQFNKNKRVKYKVLKEFNLTGSKQGGGIEWEVRF